MLRLLDKPAILQVVKSNLVPLIRQKVNEIEVMYYLLKALGVVGDFVSNLEIEDQPSRRMRVFLETELQSRLAEKDILPKLEELSEAT